MSVISYTGNLCRFDLDKSCCREKLCGAAISPSFGCSLDSCPRIHSSLQLEGAQIEEIVLLTVAARMIQSSVPIVFNITALTYTLAAITSTVIPKKTPLTARIEGAFVDRSTGPVGVVGSILGIERLSTWYSSKLVFADLLLQKEQIRSMSNNDFAQSLRRGL